MLWRCCVSKEFWSSATWCSWVLTGDIPEGTDVPPAVWLLRECGSNILLARKPVALRLGALSWPVVRFRLSCGLFPTAYKIGNSTPLRADHLGFVVPLLLQRPCEKHHTRVLTLADLHVWFQGDSVVAGCPSARGGGFQELWADPPGRRSAALLSVCPGVRMWATVSSRFLLLCNNSQSDSCFTQFTMLSCKVQFYNVLNI